jgi:cytochrome P450
MDPAVQSCPYDFYAQLRATSPVYLMPETGFYVVTRYEDLRRVLADTETFSNAGPRPAGQLQGATMAIRDRMLAERGWVRKQTLQRTDPPEHTRYRKLVNRVFTARRVRTELAPRIDEIVAELIDAFIDRGSCEFMSEFAVLLPALVMTEQLGLDRGQVNTFKDWTYALLAPSTRALGEEEMVAVTEAELEAQHHFAQALEERRARPTEDLTSALVNSHLAGGEEPLTMNELQDLMHQLITGGFETTATAIAHGMRLLLTYPDQMQLLRSDPDRYMQGFVEETLRIESPAQGLTRRTTRDVELSGTLIPEGSVVIVRYGSGNRDESQFPEPERFDITRPNLGTHMAFGNGPHFCVGAALARQEMSSAFAALLTRLEDIRIAAPLPDPLHAPNLFVLVFKEMHLSFRRAMPAG